MSTKKITVFSTSGKSQEIVTDALDWGTLKNELSAKGINVSGMQSVIGKSKLVLAHNDAVLPDGDFTLFNYPTKTKSGSVASDIDGLSFADLRAKLKDLQSENADAFKSHFSADKSYTNKSSADLKTLLKTYKPKASKGTSTKAVATTKAAEPAKATKSVASVVDSVSKAKAVKKAIAESEVKETKELPKSTTPTEVATYDTEEDKIDAIGGMIKSLTKPSETDKDVAIRAVAKLKLSRRGGVDEESLKGEYLAIGRGLEGIRL